MARDAGREAPFDVVLQARPIAPAVDHFVARPNPEQPVRQGHRPARDRGGHEGAGVDVAIARDLARHQQPRRRLGRRQLQVRIGLVVAQQDVETGVALLDQPVFEGERLDDRVGDDDVERGDVADEGVQARTGAFDAQVRADAVAQDARFADVQRLAARTEEQIDARLLRQPIDLALEFVNSHALTSACFADVPQVATPVTFTGAIGRATSYPLRLIIAACVRLRIHPNLLTFVGVLISIAAGWALAIGDFMMAGVIMVGASIFDFIDGKVAQETGLASLFGGFWDSVIDRFSDLALSVGLICLYASLGRVDLVLLTSIAMVFATMTSYTRARAESLIKKCKVGFMERPERIVLFMIGAFTNRMVNVMWIIAVLSVVTVINRIQYTYLELNGRPQPRRDGISRLFVRAFYWTEERTTIPYDLWVIAILAFCWLIPPDWLRDPMAVGSKTILQLLFRN